MAEIKQVPSKVKGVADIVFCIDSTGSMTPCIDNVKANIGSFVETIKTSNPNTPLDWRAKILGYRDFNIDSEYLIDNDFVTTTEELQNQLSRIVAEGGGDLEESTFDAILYATLKSQWRERCHKIIVVFTDAPPLGNFNSKTTSELGIPDSFEVFKQMLAEKHIKLFLYGPKHPLYQELSLQSRLIIEQMDNAEEGLKNLDFKTVLETIGKTVSDYAGSGEVL